MEITEILIWFILLPPFIGAIISSLCDYFRQDTSRFVGILSIAISAITNLITLIMFLNKNWPSHSLDFIIQFETGNQMTLSLLLDSLSIFMGLIASFLGLLIAIFSLEYMSHDKHTTIYWFFFQLFVGGMLLLVLAGDFILLYAGWEIVGLCSFGLISHWRNKPGEQGRRAALAGIKAFVFTRIGDIGFLIAIVLTYQKIGSVNFQTISEAGSNLSSQFLSIIGVLFLIAAFGKSAQIPFIPWLSSPENVNIDAMQGPTTVSALIHAATMVKAGVYLISRLFLLLPLWNSTLFLWVLLLITGLTTFIAALSAVVSFDLKRILAYSTVSQLGYMFLGLALAFISKAASNDHLALTAFLSVQFHLVSHAIFKSLLFLSAGYLIHVYGTQNIRNLRAKAAWKNDPLIFIALMIGGLGLAGVPPINGYFSKEAIIGTSFVGILSNDFVEMYQFVYAISVATAIITAIYVSKLFFYLFFGEMDGDRDRNNYPLMCTIISILSILALFGGLFQLVLPEYFVSLIGEAEFHHLFGENIALTLTITLLIPIIVFVTLELFKQDKIVSISEFLLVEWLANLARAGFYLEDLWRLGLTIFTRFLYEFRKTHSGKLNDMVLGSSVVILAITSFITGGGF